MVIDDFHPAIMRADRAVSDSFWVRNNRLVQTHLVLEKTVGGNINLMVVSWEPVAFRQCLSQLESGPMLNRLNYIP